MNAILYLILGFYCLLFVGSVILFTVKVIERKKEKRNENIDKYKKY